MWIKNVRLKTKSWFISTNEIAFWRIGADCTFSHRLFLLTTSCREQYPKYNRFQDFTSFRHTLSRSGKSISHSPLHIQHIHNRYFMPCCATLFTEVRTNASQLPPVHIIKLKLIHLSNRQKMPIQRSVSCWITGITLLSSFLPRPLTLSIIRSVQIDLQFTPYTYVCMCFFHVPVLWSSSYHRRLRTYTISSWLNCTHFHRLFCRPDRIHTFVLSRSHRRVSKFINTDVNLFVTRACSTTSWLSENITRKDTTIRLADWKLYKLPRGLPVLTNWYTHPNCMFCWSPFPPET